MYFSFLYNAKISCGCYFFDANLQCQREVIVGDDHDET